MDTFKQVRFRSLGGPEVLHIDTVPVTDPGPGELRIAVQAIGLNRAENLYRQGHYLYQPSCNPSPIGYEAAGIVEALGPGVSGFAVGDRVSTIPAFSMSDYGVYGEKAVLPVHAVSHYPEQLTPEEAASVWMQYVTAYGALVHHGQLQRGEVALFTAATGGLGVAAIQIARQLGAVSIATTRSRAKAALLQRLEPDHLVVTDEEDITDRVLAITGGRGANLVFDAVGGAHFPKLADATARHGQIITYGALAPDAVAGTPMPWRQLLQKSIVIRGYTLFDLSYDPLRFGRERPYDPVAYPKALDFVRAGLASGALKPVIAQVFPFERIIEAHQAVETNAQLGKVVVRV
jgi:NADPH:quinone reductase-like Zn-dependent oxidoreductase